MGGEPMAWVDLGYSWYGGEGAPGENTRVYLQDLSMYIVPTNFLWFADQTKITAMQVVSALTTKVVGMQASNQIQD